MYSSLTLGINRTINLLSPRLASVNWVLPDVGLWYAAVDRAFSRQVTQLQNAFDPTLADPLDQLNHAIRRIRPISLRALFFLIAHGAAAPFTLAALARHFDNTDPLRPNQITKQAALTADVITHGLRLDAPDS
jgi:hypothetical protein